MVVCGYNSKMGRGIELLFEGMYYAAAQKAEHKGVPFRTVLERELVEIPEINAALQTGAGNPLRMFAGLNDMARSIFETMSARPSFAGDAEAFMSEVDTFVRVLREAEEHNLAIPLATGGNGAVARRAEGLGRWIVDNFSEERV